MLNNKIENVVYGSLLHDIGKLIQRALNDKSNSHSKIGFDYIKNTNNPIISNNEILNSIKCHHYKDIDGLNLSSDDIAYIVYEADNISSGIDRRSDNDNKNDGQLFASDLPLQSVFNKIGENTKYAYYLRDFNEKKYANYPEENEIRASQDKYCQIKKILDENIKDIKGTNSLLQLLESICSFVPSSTNTSQVADISLYDHLKLTCAIASCIYSYFQENNIDNYVDKCFKLVEENRQTEYYQLVSLDISGVQDFIYTIASKNALKSLRARSFYLDFLMEYCCNQLIKQLHLSRANILYQGGGHAYLLLPNTKEAKEKLTDIIELTNDWFLEHFSTALYLSYACAECNSLDLMQNCANVFKNVSKELSKNKLNRYSKEQLEDIFDLDFIKLKNENNERECNICRTSSKNINNEGVCDLCLSLINLGKYLCGKDDLAICISSNKTEYSVELPTYDNKPKYFNLKTIKDNNINKLVDESDEIYTINKWYSGDNKYANNIWLGNYSLDSSIDFASLAELSTGIKRLGILRADVDNLGSIFVSGIKKEYSSISRHATLSRQLSMFFKYYINQLCEGLNVVIIYSGGDDVFVAGAWNDVIKFAINLNQSFKKYTCNKLTFSCGIGLFKPSYPVYKMAELVGNLEDIAKLKPNKNSISLFGESTNINSDNLERTNYVFSWEEFYKITSYIEEIKEYCYFDEENKTNSKLYFSNSFMYKILNLISKNENVNVARLAYTLARIEPKKTKENENLVLNYNKLKKLLYELFKTNKNMLETILYLIIYENRKD